MKLQSLQFYINSKTTNLHHVKSVIIFAKMVYARGKRQSTMHMLSCQRRSRSSLRSLSEDAWKERKGEREKKGKRRPCECGVACWSVLCAWNALLRVYGDLFAITEAKAHSLSAQETRHSCSAQSQGRLECTYPFRLFPPPLFLRMIPRDRYQ